VRYDFDHPSPSKTCFCGRCHANFVVGALADENCPRCAPAFAHAAFAKFEPKSAMDLDAQGAAGRPTSLRRLAVAGARIVESTNGQRRVRFVGGAEPYGVVVATGGWGKVGEEGSVEAETFERLWEAAS